MTKSQTQMEKHKRGFLNTQIDFEKRPPNQHVRFLTLSWTTLTKLMETLKQQLKHIFLVRHVSKHNTCF